MRVTLILVRQGFGKRYIVNRTRAKPRDYYVGDVVEGARLSGADVEDAAARPTLGQGQVHANDVVHKNKIATLLSVAVSAGALEQARASTGLQLAVELIHHRGHLALVGFARAVDVEVSQTGDGACRFRGDDAHVTVEGEFGKAVEIEGPFVFARRCERLDEP